MNRVLVLGLISVLFTVQGACGQNTQTMQPGSNVAVPGYNPYQNPYMRPGMRPYGYGNPYARYPGYGYGTPVYGAPVYGAPVQTGGGFFRIGNFAGYWRAPSGYYYPWMANPGVASQPIVIVQDGSTTASKPPVSTMFSDIENYLDDSKGKKKITDNDYNRLRRRLKDLQQKYYSERSAQGGTMADADDDNARRNLDLLSAEIARTVR